MSTIKPDVRRFLNDNFILGTDGATLADDDSFLEAQILDSTGFLELITYLEEKHGIKIDGPEMLPENLDSLNAIESFLLRKLAP